MTNANFCLRQLAGAAPNTGKLREAISEIVNDGTRASAVISRIRALLQKGAPERVELDINQVIEEVAVLLRDELTRNHVSLRTDLGADLPRVSGDRVQLASKPCVRLRICPASFSSSQPETITRF